MNVNNTIQMNMNSKKTPKQLYSEYFKFNPQSRFNKWCRKCVHSCNLDNDEPICQWYGKTCQEAVWHDCPIPSAFIDETPDNCTCSDANSYANVPPQKGGTVVPPSNFQLVRTKRTETKSVTHKTPRPRASAQAHPREETPTAQLKK